MQTSRIVQQLVDIITSLLRRFKSPHSPEHKKAERLCHFTFMLPCCIVIDFLLNNQPDALIIQIDSVIKLYRGKLMATYP